MNIGGDERRPISGSISEENDKDAARKNSNSDSSSGSSSESGSSSSGSCYYNLLICSYAILSTFLKYVGLFMLNWKHNLHDWNNIFLLAISTAHTFVVMLQLAHANGR